LRRESHAFLTLSSETRIISDKGGVKLVSVNILLENKGNKRITARTKRNEKDLFYSDKHDECLHAGTLKIRQLPVPKTPVSFNWYDLEPLKTESSEVGNADFEQINYLHDHEDPQSDFKEVDFWLEPKETCRFEIPVWLRPGIYCSKVFFIGEETRYYKDDYWSFVSVFEVS